MYLNIHHIEKVVLDDIRKLGKTGTFSRDIEVQTENGESLKLTLFSEKESALCIFDPMM